MAAGAVWLALAMAPAAHASDISFLLQFKNLSWTQVGNGNDLSFNGGFYSADLETNVANPYITASLTYPGPGSPANLPQISPTDYGFQTGLYSTQAAMDADFPFGVYTYKGDNGDSAGYDYTADDYANSTPFLTGSDYSNLQGMNASLPFTFHFNPDDPGTMATESYVFFTIFDRTTSTLAYDDGFLPASTTSVTVPGGTLTPGDMYSFELDYSNRDILRGLGTSDFPPELGFDLRDDGTFTAAPLLASPEPATAGLIGLGLVAAALLGRRFNRKPTR